MVVAITKPKVGPDSHPQLGGEQQSHQKSSEKREENRSGLL